ncbi:MAG: DNA polymerase III subunit alpha [Candidatus Marinimicrobia bacterium]|nr:DNA polymerase III subunit alpha [Candidatus Neomarinimicrobiota bacterium]|tara:strand:+ start:26908 stop:30342 length:3435 start_codon:yes stop_codon:yes gene_type:complete
MSDFVHLHNHTDYSLLDASQTVEQMCNRVYDLGMDSIAVTDHGNLFAMIPFYKQAQKAGIKAIIGCEIYVSVKKHTEKTLVTTEGGKKWGYHHLVLLAQNQIGYRNLMKLCSIGYLEGFYYRPRVDKDLLRKYNEGLIATSACLAGEVTSYAAIGDYDNAKKAALEYKEIFPDRFYLELQNHDIPEEKKSHIVLKKLSKELDIPLVATNDCHYCLESHSDAHDALFCLGTGKDVYDTNRLRYEPGKFYVKSADEMYKIFPDTPEALENTVKIAEQCNVEIPIGEYHLPAYPVKDNQSPDDYLKDLCIQGLELRYSNLDTIIKQRLEHELQIIKKMGYAGYFLITQDFVNYAKNNGIPVGPGRGSAAGSLVAYATGITDVDPIKYNLLFERFLNPERVTMPDIDIDFCIEGREKVIDYIKAKYGHKSVAQIITFGTMKAKSVIRDVGRVLGMSYAEVDSIAKLVPNELNIKLDKASKLNPELGNISKKSDLHNNLMEYSKILEGCHRHASTHAAGVVIAPGPLTDYVPLFKNTSTNDIATQADMNGLEDLGLLKLDFLGLRNLTVINKTLNLISLRHNQTVEINQIDLYDKNVYANIFANGHTTGIFQFESDGMKEYLAQLKPTGIEDLIALNALYRPGPMANVPEFIDRKHGKSPIVYIHQTLEPILKETYGIIVYQEQVMQISSEIGGFSLAESDIMRRAMGKKKKNLMSSYKIQFIKGAQKNSLSEKVAAEIFELLERFAEYGFNKSHATAYALIAYQTAWLKHYYPIEFLTANISSNINDTNNVVKLIADGRRMGITVNPPDINKSYADFTILDDKTMQYGLAAIKNVGYKASHQIAQYRDKKGKYNNVFELITSDTQHINKKVIESLILVGACNCLGQHRAQLFKSLDIIIEFGTRFYKSKNKNQESLFNNTTDVNIVYPILEDCDHFPVETELKYEKELLGFYLSNNPLAKYEQDFIELSTINSDGYNMFNTEQIQTGGIITNINLRYDKNGNQWAIITLATLFNSLQVYVFHNVYLEYLQLLQEDNIVFIKGKVSNQSDTNHVSQIIANKIYTASNLRSKLTQYVNIKIDNTISNDEALNQLFDVCQQYQGKTSIVLHMMTSQKRYQKILIHKYPVSISNDALAAMRLLFGVKAVWLS